MQTTVRSSSLSYDWRPYQQEMFEASMARNIIVAMDTGSGKTHIAISRILAELERSEGSKLVWFMTPSVALSMQQLNNIKHYVSAYPVISLIGADGVDKWKDQRLWDAILSNVRVVVGTPKVLEDALTHGFVQMSRLALLVFDEAHNCIRDTPMNSILQKFYHPCKSNGEHIPHILGLSASPVMYVKQGSLERVEANLDAVAITPKTHRSSLEQFVHPPQVNFITYKQVVHIDEQDFSSESTLRKALERSVMSYDFSKDPYLKELMELDDDWSRRRLEDFAKTQKTWCIEQLRVLERRASTIFDQLGSACAEWYLAKCIDNFCEGRLCGGLVSQDVKTQEAQHLADIFGKIASTASAADNACLSSNKAEKLVAVLMQQDAATTRGIIFVEQRAMVTALAQFLRSHPATSESYSVGTFVGNSNFTGRKFSVADLNDRNDQGRDLEDFRNGTKNLIVATSVLQEGIDVPACNLVVCFDMIKTLIEYVQRRGRARQKGSKYIMFIDENKWKADSTEWQKLEMEMKQAYMNEHREIEVTEPEDEDALRTRLYRVPSTGALLTLENAKAHLYHFCAVSTLQASNYVDLRPEFGTQPGLELKTFTASVILPSFVHPEVRSATSSRPWRTETAAIKDAAFEAYVALHKAGLVNDHLLPLVRDYALDPGQVDQPSIVLVSERLSPWLSTCSLGSWYPVDVTLDSSEFPSLVLWLPNKLISGLAFRLFWNENTTYTVDVCSPGGVDATGDSYKFDLEAAREWTYRLLCSVHGHRMTTSDDFVILLSPAGHLHAHIDRLDYGLISINGRPGQLYIYSHLNQEQLDDSGTPLAVVSRFPKRKDFLHPVPQRQSINSAYTALQAFPAAECKFDPLPARFAIFAAFIPSILHRIEIQMIAQTLRSTILERVRITDIRLIIEAISAPSALETADYNRLEYLGDAILKFIAHLQVMAQYPTWPEGYLNLEKYHLVRNSTLTQAALDAGIDKYVLTKPFTGSKWRPVYMSEVLASSEAARTATREVSSKVLADVVEALIGAAYVDGGVEKADLCIRTLLPKETWYEPTDTFTRLLSDLPPCPHKNLHVLEQLIGHTFSHPTLLLEAITHASLPCNRTGMSYERLEFLGDSVLDLIVVPKLHTHHRALKHWELHRVHEALVNGHFLGYCCISYGIEESMYKIVEAADKTFDVKEEARRVHLHDFIRAGGQVVQVRRRSLETFSRYRAQVDYALADGTDYPWPDLVAMNLAKFFSDLVESVLGALYIDTRGDLSVCEGFVENLGILRHMRRILDDGVETAPPKERVGILAGGESVEYVNAVQRDAEDKGGFSCTVKVGQSEVVTIGDCGNKSEAEVRAAYAAAKILEARVQTTSGRWKKKLDIAMKAQEPQHDDEMTHDGMIDEEDK